MSAIKEYMATIAESKNRTSMLLNAWREISDRLDALDAKAHEHPDKVQPADWTVVIKGDVPYRVASFVGPSDTERSCEQPAQEQGGVKKYLGPLDEGKADGSDVLTAYDTQEQLWICPKHEICDEMCNSQIPHERDRFCDEHQQPACPKCIPYAREQGAKWDPNATVFKITPTQEQDELERGAREALTHYLGVCKERADLRARLEQAEKELALQKQSAFETGELALKRGFEIERLEKENAELKRKVDEKDSELSAWHNIFQTSQLSHAQARLEQAEKENAELKRKLESEVKR